jgi:hypothetical protein
MRPVFYTSVILAAPRLLLFIVIVLKLAAPQKHDVEIYNRLISCMNRSVYAYAVDWSKVKILPHDADEHYADLLTKTAHLRQLPVHKAAGYAGNQLSYIETRMYDRTWYIFLGPWIENLYIQNFINKPLASFGGMIPIFVQFVSTTWYAQFKRIIF